jgi:hypothetical protein
LAEIEAFIARDNPAAASKFVDELIERGTRSRGTSTEVGNCERCRALAYGNFSSATTGSSTG